MVEVNPMALIENENGTEAVVALEEACAAADVRIDVLVELDFLPPPHGYLKYSVVQEVTSDPPPLADGEEPGLDEEGPCRTGVKSVLSIMQSIYCQEVSDTLDIVSKSVIHFI